MNEDNKTIDALQKTIRNGLSELDYEGNWLDAYKEWRELPSNQFDSLLVIKDPLDLANVWDREFFDQNDIGNIVDLDIICMSAFLSERLLKYTRIAFSSIRQEKNRERKLRIIEKYFELIDGILNSEKLAGCIVTLNEFAEKQLVLYGSERFLDLYISFFSLKENLRKRSIESLYMLFTHWRITMSKKTLKTLINAVIDYVQTYYVEFDKDPEMGLFHPMEGLMNIRKLAIICHWLEHIAFHTDGIFEKYKELDWLIPTDRLVDELIPTNQISRYEMHIYKKIFEKDDDDTVQKKAVCNHGYGIWIKTVDVMYIVCDIFQVLYTCSDDYLVKMNTKRTAILEGYDNMTKIRDYYTRKVFFHQVYYQLERQYFDSQVLNALEEDAALFSASVDNVISYVEAIAGDETDIEKLLQAKQNYIDSLTVYITEEQENRLDELTSQVVEKLKTVIQKLAVYDDLYRSVSIEFLPYAGALMQHPQIFCSLVSAEYLYSQYVEKSEPNAKFDYSCISIMYYMSLEDFLNKLVYTPYYDEVLSKIPGRLTGNDEWKTNGALEYVSKFRSFWDNKSFKRSCEIGVLGYLFEQIETETYFKSYVTHRYPKADVQRIKRLGTELKKVAPRRNEAAHGGNYLTYTDVQTDKGHVYNTAADFKGLIIELMNIIL